MPKKERSRRPMPRPEADESTTRAGTATRPQMRPDDFDEMVEIQRLLGSDDAAYRASRREAEDMDMQEYAEGGRVRSTRRMPSGAQQYTRGDKPRDRMQNIEDYFQARRGDADAERMLDDAMYDEVRATGRARETEIQTDQEDRANRRRERGYVEGGMVRGCKPAQMSGKGFKGTF